MSPQGKSAIYAIATLSGTIIGAGLFALPYVTMHVGIWTILGYFAVLGAVAILIHMFFGELALHTPDFKRVPGFAKIYLGSWGERVSLITATLGLFGALLAYLILGGQFFFELGHEFLGGNILFYTLLYFTLAASLIFFGIKAIAKVELWGLIAFFLILFFIFLRGQPFLEPAHLFTEFSWEFFLFPYGVVLFALWGAALIPETEEILGVHKHLLLKIIPLAILIPAAIYLLFIYLVLGISGPDTTENALSGLRHTLGDGVISGVLMFGLLTAFTSFLTLGLTLKKVLWYDMKLNQHAAWAVTCFVPLGLFLAGFQNFIAVIGFLGAVLLGTDGVLILLMYRKLQQKKMKELEKIDPSPHEREVFERSRKKVRLKMGLVGVLILVLVTGVVLEVSSLIR